MILDYILYCHKNMAENKYKRGPYGKKKLNKTSSSNTISEEVFASIRHGDIVDRSSQNSPMYVSDSREEPRKRKYKKRCPSSIDIPPEDTSSNIHEDSEDETEMALHNSSEMQTEDETRLPMKITERDAAKDVADSPLIVGLEPEDDGELGLEHLLEKSENIENIEDTEEILDWSKLLDNALFEYSVDELGNDDDLIVDANEEDVELDDEDKAPLYEGANISIGAFMLLLAVLFSQNNAVGDFIEQTLSVFALALPKGHKLGTTLYSFKKYFRNLKNPLVKHHYCSDCLAHIKDNSVKHCPNNLCQKRLLKTDKQYFIEIPLAQQIQNFLSQNKFYSKLQHRFNRTQQNGYEDIYDGDLYKSYCADEGPLSSGDNISFLLNTDGAPVFKSSKVSVWPIYLAINELPYKERMKNENMLLAGLWFGSNKPSMNTYLKPLHETMKQFDTGVKCSSPERGEFVCKAYLLAVTADLPAKCLLCNSVQYNGYYSCWKCKQKGESAKVGKGHSHVYPYQADMPKGPARTRQCVIKDARAAVNQGNNKTINTFGVKGPSRLLLFPKFDIIKGVSIDYMHGVLLGVQKLLIRLWFLPEFKGQPFSFHNSVLEVDRRLQMIKPTMAVTRLPRPIDGDLKYWKASEYRSFLLFYGVAVLRGILDELRFHHYLNFVSAIHTLLKQGSSEIELSKAEDGLQKFVQKFDTLYGKCYMTLNIHQLLHLTDSVRELGPLYTHSCFDFENKNGYILKLIRGSQNIDNQILNGISFIQKLPELKQQCIAQGSDEDNVYKCIVQPNLLKKQRKIGDDTYVLGATQRKVLDQQKLDVILEYLGHFPHTNSFNCFNRISLKGMLIYSLDYGRMVNRNNATIKFRKEEAILFGQVIVFVELENVCVAIVELLDCRVLNLKSHILKVKKTDKLTAVPLQDMLANCMLIDLSKSSQESVYVCLPPNNLENE